METSKSLCGIRYGTTIYKITDCNLEVELRDIGEVSDPYVEYDVEYNTYDISFDFDNKVSGSYRVFVYLKDGDDNGGYYMVFDGYSVLLKEGKQSFTVKIPVGDLSYGDYKMNIMVQNPEGNYMSNADNLEIVIPETLNNEP